jgi:hypothetical protein
MEDSIPASRESTLTSLPCSNLCLFDWTDSKLGGAESGAVDAETGDDDPRLAWLIDAWPTLMQSTRDEICQLVRFAPAFV